MERWVKDKILHNLDFLDLSTSKVECVKGELTSKIRKDKIARYWRSFGTDPH